MVKPKISNLKRNEENKFNDKIGNFNDIKQINTHINNNEKQNKIVLKQNYPKKKAIKKPKINKKKNIVFNIDFAMIKIMTFQKAKI